MGSFSHCCPTWCFFACGPKTAHARRVFWMRGVGWGGARCYRHVNVCTSVMLRYRHLLKTFKEFCDASPDFHTSLMQHDATLPASSFRLSYIFDATLGWGGVGQDVTVMWTSAHLWCYATGIFSRLSKKSVMLLQTFIHLWCNLMQRCRHLL